MGQWKLTVCIPQPRPRPPINWYTIHFAVEVSGWNVDTKPAATETIIELAIVQGR